MRRVLCQMARLATVVVGAAVLVVVVGGPVWAAPAPDPTAELVDVIERARDWLMSIAWVVAGFFATVGALQRMWAKDDPGEVQRSNSSFRNAFVGVGLAVLTPVLVEIFKSIVEG